MKCPTLAELPSPPKGKTGWPWTEESSALPDSYRGEQWPVVTVVTPSYNQGRFLEEALRSVLLQGYPNLEYLVMDGGSNDGSGAIIMKYSRWLSYWRSEPDGGQSQAINEGLERATGGLACWVNSDDILCRNALFNHFSRFPYEPRTIYLGVCTYIDVDGRPGKSRSAGIHSFEEIVQVGRFWRGKRLHIVQPEVLFPRAMALEVGGLNPDNHYSMDYELWGRLLLAGARIEYTNVPFGMFRQHPDQKTQNTIAATRSLVDAARRLTSIAGCIPEKKKQEILEELDEYLKVYEENAWRGSGRLARIGLPKSVVIGIRKAKEAAQRHLLPLSDARKGEST